MNAEAVPPSDPGAITHARVLKIAAPIMISNATVPILGVVDTGVVGQMGQAAPIGAVGLGAIILTAIYWIFGFLRMGTVGLASQARGAGDNDEVAALLTRALLIGIAGGTAIILLQVPIFAAAFRISPASEEVEALVRDYMAIRVWSAPAIISTFAFGGWLLAQERALAVLALQVWMNGANIILDLWFVLGLGWGVEGVAWATFVAEWSGFALGLWLCRSAFATAAWRIAALVFDKARFGRMMAINRDVMIRSLILEGIFVSFLFFSSDFGDLQLAANQILLQFLHVTAYALDGFAFAAEALVGQAMGARNRATVRRASLLTSFWGLLCAIALSAAFAVAGGRIIDVMTTAETVRAEARAYLLYMTAAPLAGAAAWMLDGIFIGATRAADMRNMIAISAAVYAAAAFMLAPTLGNHGLWMALLISFIARGATLGLRYPALERQAERPA